MKKALLFVTASLLLAACSAPATTPEPTPEPTEIPSEVNLDNSEEPSTPKFTESSVNDIIERANNGESYVAYFGFEGCPWCKEAVPVLEEVMEDYGYNVLYINTRSNPEWKSNTEIDDYDKLTEFLGDNLKLDDEGLPHLYVPYFVFVRKGELVGTHQGTVEGHNAHEREMTEEERATFKGILGDGFLSAFSQTE